MAIYQEDIVDIDIKAGTVFRSFVNKAIGEGDSNGNRFGMRLFKDGEQVSLVGASCVGYFVRSDGITLVINGGTSDGVAYVDLPEAAYAKEGNFLLTIKLSGTGFASSMRIVDGTVVGTTTEDIADPGGEIPPYSEYESLVEDAEAAADDIDGLSISATLISGTRYKIAVTKE